MRNSIIRGTFLCPECACGTPLFVRKVGSHKYKHIPPYGGYMHYTCASANFRGSRGGAGGRRALKNYAKKLDFLGLKKFKNNELFLSQKNC